METTDETVDIEQLAHKAGFMSGMAAVLDASKSQGNSLKGSAELIGHAVNFSPTHFLNGFSKAVVIALKGKTENEVLAQYLMEIQTYK
jgi:hypothetical protein